MSRKATEVLGVFYCILVIIAVFFVLDEKYFGRVVGFDSQLVVS